MPESTTDSYGQISPWAVAGAVAAVAVAGVIIYELAFPASAAGQTPPSCTPPTCTPPTCTPPGCFPIQTVGMSGYYGGLYNYYQDGADGLGYYVYADVPPYYSATAPEIGDGGFRNTTIPLSDLTQAEINTIYVNDPLHELPPSPYIVTVAP